MVCVCYNFIFIDSRLRICNLLGTCLRAHSTNTLHSLKALSADIFSLLMCLIFSALDTSLSVMSLNSSLLSFCKTKCSVEINYLLKDQFKEFKMYKTQYCCTTHFTISVSLSPGIEQ